jgi:hypothetical protein
LLDLNFGLRMKLKIDRFVWKLKLVYIKCYSHLSWYLSEFKQFSFILSHIWTFHLIENLSYEDGHTSNLCCNTLCNYERHVAHFPIHTGNHICHGTELVVDTWWNALYYLVTPAKVHSFFSLCRPSEVCCQLFFSMLFLVGSWYLVECTLLLTDTWESTQFFLLMQTFWSMLSVIFFNMLFS